jgi:hypothetical protein
MTILGKGSLEVLVYEDITAPQVHRWGEDTSRRWKAEQHCKEEEKDEMINLDSKICWGFGRFYVLTETGGGGQRRWPEVFWIHNFGLVET